MNVDPVARRYARALFGAAETHQRLDPVAADVHAVGRLLAGEPRARGLLTAPQLDAQEKSAFVERLLAGRVDPLVVELLQLLLEKKRFALFADVVTSFGELMDEARGVLRARVTSAVALPEDLAARLRAELERHTGKRVELEPRVDPELLGGLRVQYGDRIIEQSVRRTLEAQRAALRQAEVYGS